MAILEQLFRFVADRRGNFALTTAILAVPIFMSVGLAVDYTRVREYRTKLQHSADAAVLAAIAEDSEGRAQAYTMRTDGKVSDGEREALEFFNSNLAEDSVLLMATGVADVEKLSDRISSKVTFSLDLPLSFGSFFGQSTYPIRGESTAEIRLDTSIDFYLLLDNTPSMGLGATTSDIDKLVARTPDRCAFACHALDNNDNYYNLAKDIGVEMRIDVVREAAQQLTETATQIRTFNKQYRMAVYSFGDAATSMGLKEVSKLSSNMNKVKRNTDALDLMTIPYQNYNNDQQTDFQNTLADLNAIMPDPGDGLGGNEPQKVLFFVTDGVNDSYKPYSCTKPTTSGRCQEPINTDICETIKARGIKIAVLYTTYLPLPDNSWYRSWIRPFEGEISTRMESCASPGFYFEVGPDEGILDAMDTLFLKTLAKLRLMS